MFFFFAEHYRYTLSEMFEIRQGIATPYLKHKAGSKNSHLYKLIYPADLNILFKSLEVNQLTDFKSDKELSTGKLLSSDDYLLSCKGIVKGFSMLYSDVALSAGNTKPYKGIVATNQFIIARPRAGIKEIYGVPYLHNLLDILVPYMNEMTVNKAGKSILRYITISDIVDISLELPIKNAETKRKEFESVYKSWKKNLDLFHKSEELLSAEKIKLSETLKIKLPEE
jgi:hypothetical protein